MAKSAFLLGIDRACFIYKSTEFCIFARKMRDVSLV